MNLNVFVVYSTRYQLRYKTLNKIFYRNKTINFILKKVLNQFEPKKKKKFDGETSSIYITLSKKLAVNLAK